MSEEYRMDRPTALTCPECGGAMARQEDGTLLQFRCHIGHVLTAETMLQAQFAALESKLEACLRSLNERAELGRLMSEVAGESGGNPAELAAVAAEALERARQIKAVLESDWKLARPD